MNYFFYYKQVKFPWQMYVSALLIFEGKPGDHWPLTIHSLRPSLSNFQRSIKINYTPVSSSLYNIKLRSNQWLQHGTLYQCWQRGHHVLRSVFVKMGCCFCQYYIHTYMRKLYFTSNFRVAERSSYLRETSSTRGGHIQGPLSPWWFVNVPQNQPWRVVWDGVYRFIVLIRED